MLVTVSARPMFEPVAEPEIASDVAGPNDIFERLDHVAAMMEARARAGQQHDIPGVVLAVQEGANNALG